MRVLVLGAGESGCGAARLAAKKGHEVLISDRGEVKDKYRKVLLQDGIELEEESHNYAASFQPEIVIKSPGIPFTVPMVRQFASQGIPVIDELEWAFRHSRGKAIAVTGSNGKSTTTLWTYHLLKKAGLKVGLAGNIGRSWAGQLAEDGDQDFWVLEMSSFQLEGIVEFRPHVAMVLNITPDHLDRYNNQMDGYVQAKMRITMNQQPGDFLVINADDQYLEHWINNHKTRAEILQFSIQSAVENGAFLNENEIVFTRLNKSFGMSVFDLALQGKHNAQNAMAAGVAGRVLEIRKEVIRESLEDFTGVPHRLEPVATVHGIHFVNDSKATNVNSTWWALESSSKPLVWIVGGVDKGNDYSMLMDLVKEKVKAIVCLGLDNSKIKEAFADVVPSIVEVQSAEQAVQVGYQLGEKGDTVLLSPACASFDLFDNYEDRGDRFKNAVRTL